MREICHNSIEFYDWIVALKHACTGIILLSTDAKSTGLLVMKSPEYPHTGVHIYVYDHFYLYSICAGVTY